MDVTSFKKLTIYQVTAKITSVRETVTVRDALPMLQADPNYIMAVVDDSEKLVGVVSHADVLKAPLSNQLLNSPLKDSGLVKKEPVTVTMDKTIEVAVTTMQEKNLNKLIVVDDQKRPLALVTKTSILRVFDRMFAVML